MNTLPILLMGYGPPLCFALLMCVRVCVWPVYTAGEVLLLSCACLFVTVCRFVRKTDKAIIVKFHNRLCVDGVEFNVAR